MKTPCAFIVLAFFACFFASSLVHADVTCANHPAFLLASKLLTRTVEDNTVAKLVMGTFMLGFGMNATPTVMTSSDLGVCSEYAGQKSCCTSSFTAFIDKAALVSVQSIQKKGTPVHKLVSLVKKFATKSGCSTKLTTLTVDQILSDTNLSYLQTLKTAANQCKITFAKAQSSLMRGAMCSICSGVEKATDYFDNGKLKVSDTSLSNFVTAAEMSIKCLADLMNDLTTIKKVIDEIYFINSIDGTCAENYASKVQAAVLDILDDYPLSNTDTAGAKKCSGKVLFNESSTCKTALDGDSKIETDAESYKLSRFLSTRVLADVEDAVSSSSGGVNTYVTSSSDTSINSDGSYEVSMDYFVAETTTNAEGKLMGFISGIVLLIFTVFVF